VPCNRCTGHYRCDQRRSLPLRHVVRAPYTISTYPIASLRTLYLFFLPYTRLRYPAQEPTPQPRTPHRAKVPSSFFAYPAAGGGCVPYSDFAYPIPAVAPQQRLPRAAQGSDSGQIQRTSADRPRARWQGGNFEKQQSKKLKITTSRKQIIFQVVIAIR
jgi:hypothetical protein